MAALQWAFLQAEWDVLTTTIDSQIANEDKQHPAKWLAKLSSHYLGEEPIITMCKSESRCTFAHNFLRILKQDPRMSIQQWHTVVWLEYLKCNFPSAVDDRLQWDIIVIGLNDTFKHFRSNLISQENLASLTFEQVIQIDSALKWNIYVKELCKRLPQKLNLLRSLYFLPIPARVDFYFKVILPSVMYGMIVWGPCGSTLLSDLEKIHVHAAKLIFGLDWFTPSEDVLRQAKWIPLGQMYIRRVLCFVFKCVSGGALVQLQHLWMERKTNYNLRRKNCLAVPRPKTDFLKKSITYEKGHIMEFTE